MTFDGRLLTTVVMFTIFASMSLLALGFPAKAGFMPLLVGVPGTILCFAQIILDLRRDKSAEIEAEKDAEPEETDETAKSELTMFMWLGAYTIGLLGFGFIIGGPILVFLYVRYCNRDSIRTALISGLGTLAVLYGIFIWLLELTLFEGLILRALS